MKCMRDGLENLQRETPCLIDLVYHDSVMILLPTGYYVKLK